MLRLNDSVPRGLYLLLFTSNKIYNLPRSVHDPDSLSSQEKNLSDHLTIRPASPLYYKNLTCAGEEAVGHGGEEKSASPARGLSLSRTQHSLNQAGMWHGVAAAWVHKYMSCGLCWFKTGRMWH